MNNKVRSDSNNSSNPFSKTLRNGLIATSLLFALWSQPAESKTVEKNMNKIEMTTDKAASPMIENIEQQSTPDYISQAETWVKKYYPQYADYFKTTLEVISTIPENTRKMINTIIEENFEIFEDDITTEKDRITTILMFYEHYLWSSYFTNQNDVKNISKELWYDVRFSAAKEISKWVIKNKWIKYQEVNKIQLEILNEKKAQNEKRKNGNNTPEIMQWDLEKILNIRIKLFDKNLIARSELKNIETITNDIKNYKEFCKITWKKPSPIWQKFIDEYNKIK